MGPVASGHIGSTHGARSNKIVWTSYMEHRFIEFMHEEFISHRLQSSTFSPPENPKYKKIVEHGLPHFDLCTQMFARNTASGGLARFRTKAPHAFQTPHDGENEQMTGISLGGSRSRDDYEDTAVLELSQTGTPQTDLPSAPFGSKRQARLDARVLQLKKCKNMDKLNESLQGKIDRLGPKATDAIERCVNELTNFKDLPDHLTLASTSEGASHDNDSSIGTPSTPGSPGSDESDMPKEFYYFRDVICPKLFRENVAPNTSVLQGEGRVTKIMSTPYASRARLPVSITSRRWEYFMQTVGMHKRHRDSMERFEHLLETIHRMFHQVLSALCTLAPEMITRPNWTSTYPKIASNPVFLDDFSGYKLFDIEKKVTLVSRDVVFRENIFPYEGWHIHQLNVNNALLHGHLEEGIYMSAPEGYSVPPSHDLHISVHKLIPFLYDNRAALHIVSNPVFHEQTKHLEIDNHLIRDHYKSGFLAHSHVPSKEKLADVSTKSLTEPLFHSLIRKLGLIDFIPSPASGG
ncbi:UNVERIFIED_CONTAM: hypothetical protein Scaly_0858200 [Sesamum calycinum]|uniref:Uncharacterized protein n=1 Tax=Sesamum calycinum TaxID=2727403 RepID=A0AAW2QVH6_9LAMI